MDNAHGLIAQIEAIFHPKSVAVVGVPRGMKSGKVFLMGLLDQGFPGHIYPVHPKAKEIDGLKAYPSISAIPGAVDLAIVLVPHDRALSVIQECANKGVKGAVLFTAGYKETGTDEGIAMEKELVRVARSAGMRLLGPNCMGLYSPKTGLSNFPQLPREPGPVAIISHSGSLTNILGLMASKKGIRFSKVVSLGNECDLTSTDFLTYLGQDSETLVIGAYLEGIKDGVSFLNALKNASLKKPVIIWKLGLNPEGRRAAASHTGALTAPQEIWKGVVGQSGAVPVVGFEACGNSGLRLAELSAQTRSTLATFVPPTGTSLRNPIDLGLSSSLKIEIYVQAARAAAADPGVDTVVIVGRGLTPETNLLYTESMIHVRKESNKPFIMVSIPEFDRSLAQSFCEAGIPFFETAERAMGTYARVYRYQLWRQERSL